MRGSRLGSMTSSGGGVGAVRCAMFRVRAAVTRGVAVLVEHFGLFPGVLFATKRGAQGKYQS